MSKKPFIPQLLPINVNYGDLIEYITKAHRAITGLDTTLRHVPNPGLLGRTMQTKEAVLSSKIEGTQATLDEVFEFEAKMDGKDEEKKKDINEISNYREALNYGIKMLKDYPISENFIKKLHSILLKSGRGQNKAPGEFRKIQVFIGRPGATIEEATFVPPPANEIIPLFSNLEKYLNSSDEKDKLVQIAIAHYQFESIHPFLDGNGRVGRLLVSLFLYDQKLLSHPFLYLSEYLEEYRDDYYALLRGVSEKQDWNSWIKFFLSALTVQAKKTETSAVKILDLYQELKIKAEDMNSIYALNLLDTIFSYPVFTTASLKKRTKIKNIQTFFNLVNKFLDSGIIKDLAPEKNRNKVYMFEGLMKVLRRK